jgi:hypothetical protein
MFIDLKKSSPWPGLNPRSLDTMASTLTITPPMRHVSEPMSCDCLGYYWEISRSVTHMLKEKFSAKVQKIEVFILIFSRTIIALRQITIMGSSVCPVFVIVN